MAIITVSAAVSHVGKVRSNNQDSGYAGHTLFAVADGMGGHAGGDVASALALQRLRDIDEDYSSAVDAEFALQEAIVSVNRVLSDAVVDHPELTGMGTTLSALVRVGHSVALAHIGDSRIYRYRDGKLTQITTDHTFVQRLVDNGRITPEEAKTHPRRSVLMRVLGDVDSVPDVDLQVMDTRPGDRWLLCSDGLTGPVDDATIAGTLSANSEPDRAANALLKASLDGGAPDNVTIVIVDVNEAYVPPEETVTVVGSASQPVQYDPNAKRPSARGLRLHTRPGAQPSHFEPRSEDYLDELIEEDRRRSRRRKVIWLAGVLVVLALVAGVLFFGYQWTQTRYYVGESNGKVAIYQGVPQNVGPLELSHVYDETDVDVSSLPSYWRGEVERTIGADSLEAARRTVERLSSVTP